MLTLIGIALPVVLMLALWRYLGAVPEPATSASVRAATTRGANAPPPAKQPTMHDFPAQPLTPVIRGLGGALQWSELAAEQLTGSDGNVDRESEAPRAAAARLLAEGRFEAAAAAYDRLLVRKPDDPALLTGKAMSLAGVGRAEDALPLIENAARLDGANPATQFNRAVILMRVGDREAAVEALNRVLQKQPAHLKARFNLGLLHQAAGRWAEAIEIWRQLTEPEPAADRSRDVRMLVDSWSHRGEAALELRQPEEAERSFLEVVRIQPRDASGWCNVGIARAEQVRRADAMTALQIALQLDPKLIPALNQMAYLQAALYRDTGEVEYGRNVVEYCRRSLAINPDQQNVALLLNAAREFDLAQRKIDAVTR